MCRLPCCGGFVPTAMLRLRADCLLRLCADCHGAAALCRLPCCGGCVPTAMLRRLCADCHCCGGFVPTAMLRRLCADCHVAAALCRLSSLAWLQVLMGPRCFTQTLACWEKRRSLGRHCCFALSKSSGCRLNVNHRHHLANAMPGSQTLVGICNGNFFARLR